MEHTFLFIKVHMPVVFAGSLLIAKKGRQAHRGLRNVELFRFRVGGGSRNVLA